MKARETTTTKTKLLRLIIDAVAAVVASFAGNSFC